MRTGKIARLSHAIRTELNHRLLEGEPGIRLIQWLNSLPEVRKVLVDEFFGRAINEQNLTHWKQGGFEDWLRLEDHRALVGALREEAAALDAETGSPLSVDLLTTHMIAGVARCLREFSATALDHPYKLDSFMTVTREIAHLQRLQLERDRLQLKREQWEAQQAKAAKEAASPPSEPDPAASGRNGLSAAQIMGMIENYHECKAREEKQSRTPFIAGRPKQPNLSQIKPRPPAFSPPLSAASPTLSNSTARPNQPESTHIKTALPSLPDPHDPRAHEPKGSVGGALPLKP